MKKRNPFLILLLCLAALIVLSGCASKDAGRQDAAAALPDTSEAASTPAEDVSPAPENPSDTEETPDQTDTEEEPVVTVTIWSYDTGEEFAYTLTPEDSDHVIAIFEGAEREFPDSPVANGISMEFVYGENYLGTAPEDIETITGDLDGRYVCLTLDAAACIELRQIITNYANADMPNEWPDTPSAGEE